ncbi:MAG: DUF222 domain-containing protein [Microcella sp.]|uniref:HNH endonuclease signature motif containing protein n=1 Tax=Microcella sp. TaxID=1913979 RepID=UPI003316465B
MTMTVAERNASDSRLETLLDELIELEVREARIAVRRAALVADVSALISHVEGAGGSSSGAAGWSPEVVAQRTTATELAAVLRVSERAATTLLEQARTLHADLPLTRQALADGRITYRHASILIDQAWSLPVEVRADFEAAALPAAETRTPERFRQRARVIRERVHPDSIDARRAEAAQSRHVAVESARDGMAWLTAYLPAEQAQGIYARLTRIARTLETGEAHPSADSRGAESRSAESAAAASHAAGDGRTLAQRRADVLADLLVDGVVVETALGYGVRAQVLVTVPVLTLLDRSGGTVSDTPAELEGYGPIDDQTARRLAAHAPSFTRLLTHPETGAVLSVGRDRYAVPADLKLWLRVRDGTCRFPGCGRSASSSDLDHTIDWQHGGRSDHDNLAHLCRSHHRLKHHTRWTVRHAGDGLLQWRAPSGREYMTRPERDLRATA